MENALNELEFNINRNKTDLIYGINLINIKFLSIKCSKVSVCKILDNFYRLLLQNLKMDLHIIATKMKFTYVTCVSLLCLNV